MKKIIFLFLILVLMFSCKRQSDSDKSVNIDYPKTDEVVLSIKKDKSSIEPGIRVYMMDGLKYKVRILMDINDDGSVTGGVTSVEYVFLDDDNDDKNYHTTMFEGKIVGSTISVVFENTPPPVGDNSEWTNHDWEINKTDGPERLLIPFNTKNYETNEWSLSDYEFSLSK